MREQQTDRVFGDRKLARSVQLAVNTERTLGVLQHFGIEVHAFVVQVGGEFVGLFSAHSGVIDNLFSKSLTT